MQLLVISVRFSYFHNSNSDMFIWTLEYVLDQDLKPQRWIRVNVNRNFSKFYHLVCILSSLSFLFPVLHFYLVYPFVAYQKIYSNIYHSYISSFRHTILSRNQHLLVNILLTLFYSFLINFFTLGNTSL